MTFAFTLKNNINLALILCFVCVCVCVHVRERERERGRGRERERERERGTRAWTLCTKEHEMPSLGSGKHHSTKLQNLYFDVLMVEPI